MNSTQLDVLALCKKYGPLLKVPEGLEGWKLMAAIASNESSLGVNIGPRHEPAWDVGGTYGENPEQKSLLEQFGPAAAMSYGPWQLMFYNTPGYLPEELRDFEICARAFVAFFNNHVAAHKPTGLTEIGQIYNHGSKTDHPSPGVVMYCKELKEAYDRISVPSE